MAKARKTRQIFVQSIVRPETKGKRARELFEALDDDGNGTLDEDEFVQVLKYVVDFILNSMIVSMRSSASSRHPTLVHGMLSLVRSMAQTPGPSGSAARENDKQCGSEGAKGEKDRME